MIYILTCYKYRNLQTTDLIVCTDLLDSISVVLYFIDFFVIDIPQKIKPLPEIDEDMMGSSQKGPYVNDKFVNAEDSHFFAYFMTMIIICIIGYLVYHNKQKVCITIYCIVKGISVCIFINKM